MLPTISPESAGLDPDRIERLAAHVVRHVADGWYPGAQFAFARHGKLAYQRSFGQARAVNGQSTATDDRTLFLLFSSTKPVVAAGVWALIERGLVRFDDTIAEHIPGFEANAKGGVTLAQVMSHQAGFPNATVPKHAWADHEVLRQAVCDYRLEWTPGTQVHYHGTSAHWVLAVLIETLTGKDYRTYLREEVLDPLGLDDIYIGVPSGQQARCAFIHDRPGGPSLADRNGPEWWEAGVPGAGGYASASGLASFYQMLLQGGTLNGARLLAPRIIQFATRNHTEERVDGAMGMPMHRGLGVHVRGESLGIRGLGAIAHPSTFGHGGAGSSYCWADPDSGVSFVYVTNQQLGEPAHSRRVDIVSTMAHACIVDC